MPREAGCILILARNEDEQGLKSSLESFEKMVSSRDVLFWDEGKD